MDNIIIYRTTVQTNNGIIDKIIPSDRNIVLLKESPSGDRLLTPGEFNSPMAVVVPSSRFDQDALADIAGGWCTAAIAAYKGAGWRKQSNYSEDPIPPGTRLVVANVLQGSAEYASLFDFSVHALKERLQGEEDPLPSDELLSRLPLVERVYFPTVDAYIEAAESYRIAMNDYRELLTACNDPEEGAGGISELQEPPSHQEILFRLIG